MSEKEIVRGRKCLEYMMQFYCEKFSVLGMRDKRTTKEFYQNREHTTTRKHTVFSLAHSWEM